MLSPVGEASPVGEGSPTAATPPVPRIRFSLAATPEDLGPRRAAHTPEQPRAEEGPESLASMFGGLRLSETPHLTSTPAYGPGYPRGAPRSPRQSRTPWTPYGNENTAPRRPRVSGETATPTTLPGGQRRR